MRVLLTIVFLCAFTSLTLTAQVYSKVRIDMEGSSLVRLQENGMEFDHGHWVKGRYFETEISAEDISILDRLHIPYEELIHDVSAHFHEMNRRNALASTAAADCPQNGLSLPSVPSRFRLGSMGGYFTLNEMLNILDSMRILYPGLISAKTIIADSLRTVQNRPVYYVKLGNRPDSLETSEPVILYSALHHAREPLSLSQMIMYMYYLLENYNTDPIVKRIMDETQMYFVPCLNPDGYEYNYTTNPSGGGMWRKNRRPNGGGTFGVDINRNYGFFWGLDNSGSSPTPSSDTYRGTSAFSEPETRCMRKMGLWLKPKITLNYHTYGNDVVYPWGFLSRLTPDSTVYKAIARYITEENGYKYGTGFETVGYNTNGDSDDWFYGDSISKPKSFSMTPECGDAFWMPSAEIIPTCQKLIPQNIKSALVLLDMARLQITSDRTLNGTEGNITWNVQRIGLVNTDSFVLEYSSLSPALTLSAGKSLYRNMQLMEKRSDSVQYLINSTLLTPEGVKVVFRLKYKSLVLQTDTIRFNVSDSLTMVFNSTCGSVSPNWVNRGNRNWTVTSETFVSPSFCIHESPGTSGQANATYILRSQNAIDLQNAEDGILRFYAKWDIEADYDFVQVQASDDTLSWTSLCGIYTQPGTSNQVLDEPVYDGAKLEWVKEEMSLKEFIGKKIWIRYVYKTDAGTLYRDWETDRKSTRLNSSH